MKGFYLSRQPKTGEIIYVNYDKYKGYNITPKNNIKYDGIKVNKMIIVKPSMIEKVLKRKIKNRLDLYLKTIVELTEESDDSDPSGFREALNELTRFKNIIKYKYQKHLDEKYVILLNKKIEILEYELKKKIVIRKEKNNIKDMREIHLNNMYRAYLNNMLTNNNYEPERTSNRRR